jgi:CheY-like chemotaxis protein
MGKRLLIVEDNVITRLGMASLLRRAGYSVTTAPDGRKALDDLRAQKPDLVILDMLMLSCNGWEFLENRREYPELLSIPVVIVTGLPVADDQWALELGATALVKKPIDVDDLLQKIRDILGMSDAQESLTAGNGTRPVAAARPE